MPRFIDEAFLQRLTNLRFIVKGRRRGRLSGVHASPRAGVSLEFSDYRAYAPGDDFRYIDWNVYGRLDLLLVKTFVHEADLPIYLLVDFSASMQVGIPSKAQYAAQFAAGMAYLGLKELDRVGVYPFNDRLIPGLPPRHGMGQMGKIIRLLREAEPGGKTSIDRAITQFLSQTRESGVVFIISDFLGSDEGSKLAFLGFEGEHYKVDPAGAFSARTEAGNAGMDAKWLDVLAQCVQRTDIQMDAYRLNNPDYWPFITSGRDSPLYIDLFVGITTPEGQQMGSDLNKYQLEWFVKFATGSEPLSKWDEYVNGWDRIGGRAIFEANLAVYNERAQKNYPTGN